VVARLALLASLIVLVVATAIAATRGGVSYAKDDVIDAFSKQDYALGEIEGGRWTRGAPRGPGTFLFPKPIDTAPFYVFVAPNDLLARQFFAPLAQAGGGPGVFDLLQGNIVVSSDASLTETGLTRDERHRIQAAMSLLAQSR